MAFNINDFGAIVLNKGLMRLPHHRVRFQTPKALRSNGQGAVNYRNTGSRNSRENDTNVASGVARDLEYYCKMVTVPGVAIQQVDSRRYGYGPLEAKPLTASFQQVGMSFYMDAQGDNLRFFQDWTKATVNHDMRKGMRTATGVGGNQFPFEINYKEDYAVDLEIMLYNPTGDAGKKGLTEIVMYTLIEAWPAAIGDFVMNWAESNIAELPITFNYMAWYEKRLTVSSQNINDVNFDDLRSRNRNEDQDSQDVFRWRNSNGRLQRVR